MPRGALLAIVGPNGAGKSTLLKGIAGILPVLSGTVRVEPGQRMAYLPQSSEVDRSFPLSVHDLAAMGLVGRIGLFAGLGRAEHALIARALADVGLLGFERRPIGTLSGGQMQRALFARLILQDADFLLLDEPFAAVDARTTADLMHLIRRWHEERRTVIAVLHDMELVRHNFPDTLLLARRAVAWGRTAECLTGLNLKAARELVEAFDPHAAPCRHEHETVA